MATQYEFVLRFRNEQEREGFGSMLYHIITTAALAACNIHKIKDDIMRQHPSVRFDGVTLCACED